VRTVALGGPRLERCRPKLGYKHLRRGHRYAGELVWPEYLGSSRHRPCNTAEGDVGLNEWACHVLRNRRFTGLDAAI
jgi:hypothetical protein